MRQQTKTFLAAAGIGLAGFFHGLAHGADYPARTVRIVVPYATGGGSDILARQLSASLGKAWGVGVVVDNKAGASGAIGSMEVVRAAPDGYTLLLQNATMLTSLALTGKGAYDPAHDLTPILLLGTTPIAVVAHPDAHIGNLAELAAAAKAQPDKLNYGSCGIGTPQHFAMELLKQRTGASGIGHAGYKGCAPAVTDVLGGQVPLAVVSANLVAPYVAQGRLRAVAVTSAGRYALLPDAPTAEEQGVKPFDFSIWYALMGPARLSPAVVAKIAADVDKVLADPAVQANLSKAGVEPLKGSGQDLARIIGQDLPRLTALARSAGIKAD